jgi:hypothetical protein
MLFETGRPWPGVTQLSSVISPLASPTPATPTHSKKAEWIWGVLAELEAAGLVVLADKGYQGNTYAKIPYRGQEQAGIAEAGQ